MSHDENNVEVGSEEITDINLETDSMDRITKFCLGRMEEELLGTMLFEKNLCELSGSGVVAEFKFKGDKEAVQNQLKALITYRKMVPYGEHDRPQLIKEHIAFCEFYHEVNNTPTQREIKRLMRDQLHQGRTPEREQRIIKLENDEKNMRHLLHKKGECICFNNV